MPSVGRGQPAQKAQQRRLAAARGTDESEQLPAIDVERDVGQGRGAVRRVALSEPRHAQDGLAGTCVHLDVSDPFTDCSVVPCQHAPLDETEEQVQPVPEQAEEEDAGVHLGVRRTDLAGRE